MALYKMDMRKTKREYRVPFTLEVEYALRAGNESPSPWGNDPSKACDFLRSLIDCTSSCYIDIPI